MIKIKTVFLDMDGVVTDFFTPVCTKFDLPYPPQVYHFFPDIRKEVDEFCDTTFWQNLEWMDDGRDILRAIMDTLGLDKIFFLTGMMPNIETASGKMLWIRDNLPIYLDRVILTTLKVPKSFLARPDALLIDDYDRCIDGFREAGGNAILVPRPYNKLRKYSDVSSEIVRKELEQYETIGC